MNLLASPNSTDSYYLQLSYLGRSDCRLSHADYSLLPISDSTEGITMSSRNDNSDTSEPGIMSTEATNRLLQELQNRILHLEAQL